MIYTHISRLALPRRRQVVTGLLVTAVAFGTFEVATQAQSQAATSIAQPDQNLSARSKMPAWIRAADARAASQNAQSKLNLTPRTDYSEFEADTESSFRSQNDFEHPDWQFPAGRGEI